MRFVLHLCSAKRIFLPFSPPLLLLCHFMVAADVGWLYLFAPSLPHGRTVAISRHSPPWSSSGAKDY